MQLVTIVDPLKQSAVIRRIYQDKGDALLLRFHAMQHNFPFVVLNPNTSCADLVRSKPFLLLAILLVAAFNDEEFQASCDILFRNALAIKAIVKGERSLELLQGLLVYLAWHHLYMNRETQQLYQYIQLAIGMAIDLSPYKQIPRNISNEMAARTANLATVEDHTR